MIVTLLSFSRSHSQNKRRISDETSKFQNLQSRLPYSIVEVWGVACESSSLSGRRSQRS